MSTATRGNLHIKRYHTKHATKEDIKEIIECCKMIFNSEVGSCFINNQNLKVDFFHLENGIAVYERFCKQYFPSYLEKYHDDYTQDGYMGSFVAQAFINGDVYGILCSLDADIDPNLWYETILHEMTHFYCTTQESDGESFFEKHCIDENGEKPDGFMGAGYAVWREFIAYYWGAALTPLSTPLSLVQVREKVRDLDEDVDAVNPVAKMLVSQILSYIFQNPTVRHANNAVASYELVERNRVFSSKERAKTYKLLIEAVFEQLSKEAHWKISPQFIDTLGSAYLFMLASQHKLALRNG